MVTGFDSRRSTAAFGAAVLILIGSGCATKKHVRQVVGPVEARVSQTEKTNAQQQAAIGELGNSVARADERAMDADKKAQAVAIQLNVPIQRLSRRVRRRRAHAHVLTRATESLKARGRDLVS